MGPALPPERQVRRATLGRVGTLTAGHARAAALAFLAREQGGDLPVPVPPSGPTLARLAAEYMERCSPTWKPSTRAAVTSYLNSAILPAIGHLRVDAVKRADIARWFHHYGQRRPGGANVGHSILRTMFARAIDWGHRPESAGNPCAGIARFRRPPRGRLLGAGDLARLGATLRDLEPKWPARVAAVRLILLTGCRPGEIRRLRWCEVKPDRLALTNAKTGPRDVLLGKRRASCSRGLPRRQRANGCFRMNGPPTSRCAAIPSTGSGSRSAIRRASWPTARMHDLRHSHASHAVMGGESLHVTGRLLGHRRATTTNRYAHLDDTTLSDAAERVARAIAKKLHGNGSRHGSATGVSGTM